MNKKVFILTNVALGTALGLTVFHLASTSSHPLKSFADDVYTLTLDASNVSPDGEGNFSVTTTNGNTIHFASSGLTVEGGKLNFAADGWVKNARDSSTNKNMISGLSQVKAYDKTGTLLADYTWGESLDAVSPYYQRRNYVIPTTQYSFLDEHPNYLCVKASAASTMTSLELKYTCVPGAEGGDNLQISTPSMLERLKTVVNWGSTFEGQTVEIVADIDLSETDMKAPIGNSGHPFNGILEGNNHTISNWSLTGSTASQTAPFGRGEGATFRNLTLENVTISSTNNRSAGFLGASIGCTLENISVIGTSSVTGSQESGGLVGAVATSKTTMINCTNYANLTATVGNANGGIVGYVLSAGTVDLFNCNNYGNVTVPESKSAGGLIGKFNGTSLATSSNINLCTVGADVVIKSGETVASSAYFGNTDGAGILIGTNGGTIINRGSGQVEDLISSVSEYEDFVAKVAADENCYNYKVAVLTADLDFNENDYSISGTFNGTIDGNGHTISNFSKKAGDQVGLVNNLVGGGVKNLTLDDVDLTPTASNYRVAAVAGRSDKSALYNVSASGSISGGKQAGGLIAVVVNNLTIIRDCENHTNIVTDAAATSAGGIVGLLTASSASLEAVNCVNYGNINGILSIGGILGKHDTTTAAMSIVIKNCENQGSITGTYSGNAFVGGIIGETAESSSNNTVQISNCINRGNINASNTGSFIGGITGLVRISTSTSYVTQCFNFGNITGKASVGGISGVSRIATTYCGCLHSITLTYNGTSKLASIASETGGPGYISAGYNNGASAAENHVGNRLINLDGSDYVA